MSALRLAVVMLTAMLTSVIIARSLAPGNMGVYSYAMWLVGALSVLANIGLPDTLTKYISEFMGSGDTAKAILIARRLLRTQLILALVVSGLTVCVAFFNGPYRAIIILAGLMLLAQAIQQSLNAALAGVQRFDRMARVGVYAGLAQLASVGIAAAIHSGVMGMLWASLAGLWVGAWLSYHALVQCLLRLPVDLAPAIGGMSSTYKRVTKFSLTISYVLFVNMIVWQRSEVLFLKWFSTLPQIAFYALAYSMASKLNEVATAASGTLLPLYSETFGRSGLREVGQVFETGLKYLQMLMVPVCLLAVVIAKPLVYLAYGPQYLPLVLPMQILAGSIALSSLGNVNSTLLLGAEKQSFIAIYGTVMAILNITLDVVLIPRYGALGAAIANCSAQVAGALGGTIFTLRYVKAKFPWKSTISVYVAAAIGLVPAALGFSRSRSGIILSVASLVAGMILYLVILVISGELGWREVDILRKALFGRIFLPDGLKSQDVA